MNIINYLSNFYVMYNPINACEEFYPDYVSFIGTSATPGLFFQYIQSLDHSTFFSHFFSYLAEIIGDAFNQLIFFLLGC